MKTRKERKRKRYTDNFNEIFTFFLTSYKKGILDFCGAYVDVNFDIKSEEAKFCFRSYDNGEYKYKIPATRHPNILKAVIIGKKSWGLFLNEWTDGIVDMLFTKTEILKQFEDNNIKIPNSLLIDFNNRLESKWRKKVKVLQ